MLIKKITFKKDVESKKKLLEWFGDGFESASWRALFYISYQSSSQQANPTPPPKINPQKQKKKNLDNNFMGIGKNVRENKLIFYVPFFQVVFEGDIWIYFLIKLSERIKRIFFFVVLFFHLDLDEKGENFCDFLLKLI